MSTWGPGGARPGWRRPAGLLRSLLRALFRADAPRVDYEAARRSRDGYIRTRAPMPTEATDLLRQQVDELATAGALDQGSADVFHPTIDAWVQEWSHRIEAEHDARQSVLQQREIHASAEVERLRLLAELARQRLAGSAHRLALLRREADTSAPPDPDQNGGSPPTDHSNGTTETDDDADRQERR
jgi:hypothetical protein